MKTLQADVVVVAAGLSGLAAAITAAEQGLSVIALEKSKTTGGAASMGVGPLAIGTKHQAAVGYNLTADEAFLKHMHWSHWMVDARLVYDYYRKSASTLEWLEDMGVEFVYRNTTLYTPTRMRAYAEPERTCHAVKPAEGGRIGPRVAARMTKAMAERARELGVNILLETPGKKLIMEDGKVVGVLAQSVDGEELEVRAGAVILATGGCGDNPEMLKEHTGLTWGKDLFSFRIPGNVGDGIKMAWEVGAARGQIKLDLMYQIPDNLAHFHLEGAFRQPVLWVNKLGERFMPEDCIANTCTTGNAINRQPGHTCFAIMDNATLRYYKKHGIDIFGIQGTDVFDYFDKEAEDALANGYPYFFKCDTIEELCQQTGIDLEGLQETLETYNSDCDEGYDSLFCKDRNFMRPVRKPPFYCIQSFPGAYGSFGGLKINYKTEVVKEDGYPIKGLYAVGTDACDIYGDTYPFLLGGNTMAFCLNSGRMAGEYAADYIAKSKEN